MEHTLRLEKEPIPKLLFKLSIPFILGMLAISVYNITDSIFLGHGVGTIAISALAIALPLIMTITTFGHAVGMGGASIISRALGAKNKEKAQLTLHNITTVILVLNVIFVIISALFSNTLLKIFGANEEILPYSRIYFYWCLPGVFFQNILYVLMNAIRAEGKAKFPMIIQTLAALLNVIIDPIFIFVFKWGSWGLLLLQA